MEIWKQYRDTNCEVSNLGNVRNKKTKKIKSQFKKYSGKRENDYVKVSIYIEGKKKNISVHRMVAECFLDNYSDMLEINHKNNIRYDNRVENLEMTTKEENYQYSLANGNGSQRKPVYCLDINEKRKDFISLWAAGRFIKDNQHKSSSIDHICNNIKTNLKEKTKSAYNYRWFWL